MTERIKVEAASPYEVVVGHDVDGELRGLLGSDVQRVAVIHAPELAARAQAMRDELGADLLDVHLIEVPRGEAAKTAAVAEFCWSVLGRAGFTRSDVVVGLGGGATTDLAGFVAATWLRGVGLVTVPTTVLGMVDAAVGGKTGINTDDGKNLVGAFHEPRGVLCDLGLLTTLPDAEVRSGLAEVIKCGFIADPSILDIVEHAPGIVTDVTSAVLAEIVVKGITVKARTVSSDLRETGAGGGVGREALNYGHTLGHAIERVEHYGVRHGEAVSIGMVYAAELARTAGKISPDVVARHRHVLGLVGLPTTYPGGRWDALHAGMKVDKKTRGSTLRFVVLSGIGSVEILTGPSDDQLRDAYACISS